MAWANWLFFKLRPTLLEHLYLFPWHLLAHSTFWEVSAWTTGYIMSQLTPPWMLHPGSSCTIVPPDGPAWIRHYTLQQVWIDLRHIKSSWRIILLLYGSTCPRSLFLIRLCELKLIFFPSCLFWSWCLAIRSSQPGSSPSQSSGLPSQPSNMGSSKHIGIGIVIGIAVSLHSLHSCSDANMTKTPFVGWSCCRTLYIYCLSILLPTATAARHGVHLVYWP